LEIRGAESATSNDAGKRKGRVLMNVGAIESFRAEMGRFSLVFDGQLFSDSRLHRFKAAGDRERNSWYVLRDGSLTASGVFGCWKRGFTENWYDERKGKLSQAEWADVIRGWQEAEKERERAEVGAREKARRTAAWILERSKPATSHVYLTAKAVHSHGDLRTWRHMLVVPLRDANGNLHSLQFISADGTKRFLTGGRISACSFTVANHTDGPLVICEGYSTAASVHEATGFAVVCAMNCGNLKPVAEQLRKRWPNREIIIAADNDAWTDSNPGLSTATAAAKTIGAKLALPRFQDTSSRPTDFNDLCRTQGLETAKKQIADAETPKETDDETLARLAALAPMEYERCRETEAERLGIKRVSILDEIV
jgi:putative DNA primase/helicase